MLSLCCPIIKTLGRLCASHPPAAWFKKLCWQLQPAVVVKEPIGGGQQGILPFKRETSQQDAKIGSEVEPSPLEDSASQQDWESAGEAGQRDTVAYEEVSLVCASAPGLLQGSRGREEAPAQGRAHATRQGPCRWCSRSMAG